jgi:HK97 family phage portal protein
MFFSRGRKMEDKKNFIQKWMNKFSKKRSRVGSILAWQQVGRPVWTPRQYDFLSEEGYQKNVIVYRCINLIARNLASVPWRLYRGDDEIEEHPLLDLMKSPNPMHTQVSLLESMTCHLLLSGNCYVEAVGENHKIKELYLWRPDRVQVIPGEGGIPEAYIYRVNGQERRISVDSLDGKSSVLHIRTFHPLNDWYGMSPIEAASSAIDQHNAVGAHNLALLQNGGRPSGALVVKPDMENSRLTVEERQTLKDELRLVYEGSDNAGRMMVLEGNLEWKEMGLNPKDLDFVSGKYASAREIAQAYGVPSMLVGVPGESTFTNYKEARLHLWEDTILPMLDKIMAEVNRWICPYYGGQLQFKYDADSIPALAVRREALWSKIQNADFLTIDEKRSALGYGPIDEKKI